MDQNLSFIGLDFVWSPNQLLEWNQKEENDDKYNTPNSSV
jgi:endo-beta-N-acetylglucosaminidase D